MRCGLGKDVEEVELCALAIVTMEIYGLLFETLRIILSLSVHRSSSQDPLF